MEVLSLSGGGASLEFAPEEEAEVLRRLRAIGPVRRTQGALHASLEVEGEQLIYYHEWDEPCLIAATPGGIAILQQLASEVAGSRAA